MNAKKQILTIVVTVIITLVIVFAVAFFTRHSSNDRIEDVTMIQLIATPERYDGKFVKVIGVGNIEFEGNYIALNQEEYEHYTGNRIWIALGNKTISYEEAAQYNGKYVIVEGVFDKDDRGHMSLFCGSIKDVSRYQVWDIHEDTAE